MILLKSFKGILAIFSVLTGVALLLGLLAVVLDPGTFVLPAFFGLAFPIIYVINLILLGFSLLRSKRWAIFHASLALIGVMQIGHFWNLIPSSGKSAEHQVTVMSFNVRGFNRYNWIEDTTIQGKIERLIIDQNPDVICFQEFHLPGLDDLRTIRAFSKRIGLKYFVFNDYKENNDISGLVTFSRYPLNTVYRDNFHKRVFGGNGVLVSDLTIDNEKIRIVNMHLESIRFDGQDYAYAENPTKDKSEFKIAGMRIVQRFTRAYRLRGQQAKEVAEQVKQSEYPVIVAGDANDTPISYSYQVLSSGLEDSFDRGTLGTGGTYAGNLPSFRIDYVMHSKKLITLSHRVMKDEKLSDHYPVVAELGW